MRSDEPGTPTRKRTMEKLLKTSADLVAEARSRIEEIETRDLIEQLDDPNLVSGEIRDRR